MSELNKLIEETYAQAKRGEWGKVLSAWNQIPLLARRCSRYSKPSSGWTFLHQAAYFGREDACRELIRLGAHVSKPSLDRKTTADVAHERGHSALAGLLQKASEGHDSLWAAPEDTDLLPSSCLWSEAKESRATEMLLVAYGGGLVQIPVHSRYFVDSFDRAIVGWHGSYDPPYGMDGYSMVKKRT